MLVAELQLLLDLKSSILLNIIQILKSSLSGWIISFVLEDFFEFVVEIKLTQLLQFFLHEFLFFGIRAALGCCVGHIIFLRIFLFAYATLLRTILLLW